MEEAKSVQMHASHSYQSEVCLWHPMIAFSMRALLRTARLIEGGWQLRCLRANSVLRDIALKMEPLGQEYVLTSMLCPALGMQNGLGPDRVALVSTLYAFSSPACDNISHRLNNHLIEHGTLINIATVHSRELVSNYLALRRQEPHVTCPPEPGLHQRGP